MPTKYLLETTVVSTRGENLESNISGCWSVMRWFPLRKVCVTVIIMYSNTIAITEMITLPETCMLLNIEDLWLGNGTSFVCHREPRDLQFRLPNDRSLRWGRWTGQVGHSSHSHRYLTLVQLLDSWPWLVLSKARKICYFNRWVNVYLNYLMLYVHTVPYFKCSCGGCGQGSENGTYMKKHILYITKHLKQNHLVIGGD